MVGCGFAQVGRGTSLIAYTTFGCSGKVFCLFELIAIGRTHSDVETLTPISHLAKSSL